MRFSPHRGRRGVSGRMKPARDRFGRAKSEMLTTFIRLASQAKKNGKERKGEFNAW